MDTRTGRIYESRDTAIAAGAFADDVQPVTVTGKTLRIEAGPFKGRIYDVMSNGRRGRRRRDLEMAYRAKEGQ